MQVTPPSCESHNDVIGEAITTSLFPLSSGRDPAPSCKPSPGRSQRGPNLRMHSLVLSMVLTTTLTTTLIKQLNCN